MRKELLLEAILLYSNTANDLIVRLAEKFHLDLNSSTPFTKLVSRSNDLWRGNLNNEWTYWFHGGHCDFENLNSKQYLHVNIVLNIFGAIDYFYLYNFVQTTESLQHILKAFNSEKIFYETIDELLEDGILINTEEFPFKRLVLKN